MELTKYKLGELLTIKNGKDYKHIENGDIPVFGSGGYMCSIGSYLYDQPSILLPRKGTLSNIQFYDKGAFWTVDTCFYSLINEELVDGYYLYRLLRSIDLSGLDTGASIPSMTQKTYNGIKISLPPLPTQRKIASILSSYDSLIENNTKRIRLLEQMAENLYKEWFVRFRFPEHENTEFVDGLPKGWTAIRIKKMTSLKSGFAFKSEWFTDDGYAVAKIKDIGNIIMDTSDFSYVYEENCKKAERYKLVEGDLTIALTGATIGKISIVPKYNKPLYTNQRLGKFFNGANPIDKLPFLYCLFSQDVMIQNIINLANSSSAQPNISPEQIENIKFIGDLRLIDIFNKTTKNLFKEILNLHYQSTILTRQRDLLLPRLMSGKLEVKS